MSRRRMVLPAASVTGQELLGVKTASRALIKCCTRPAAVSFAKKRAWTHDSRTRTPGPKSEHEYAEMFIATRLSRYYKRYAPARLLEFGTTGVGSFGGPILVNESILVGKKGPPAGRIEHLGIRVEGVA